MYRSNYHIERYLEFTKDRLKMIPKSKVQGVALFELHMDYPTHIAFGEIAVHLLNQGIKSVGYKPIQDLKIKARLSLVIQRYFRIDKGLNWPLHIFRGIGISSFVIHTARLRPKVWATLDVKRAKFKTKDEVLEYRISNVLIGDLFYDWHMNIRHLGTVDITSKNFNRDLVRFIKTFHFWQAYFKKNNPKAVFVSHTCYAQGLLSRIAIDNGVPSYQITGDRMYRMSESQIFADSEYEYYDPQEFNLFNYSISIERAKKQITQLQLGKIGVDASHSQVSGYVSRNTREVIEKSSKQKILVVSHCFSDSPNGFGAQLFPDYFEWLLEVLQASRTIDADWYIRPHPGFVHNDHKIFQELIAQYPHIRDVGIDNSIPGLIKQGITTVLTSHGTVGFEAAIEGAYVIGASQHAFYKNYDFVYIPKSREEWRYAISQLYKPNNRTVKLEDVYHYYDIHHLRSETSWLFRENYNEFLIKVGGLRKQFTNPEAFSIWLDLSNENHKEANQDLLRVFFKSKKYFYKFGSQM